MHTEHAGTQGHSRERGARGHNGTIIAPRIALGLVYRDLISGLEGVATAAIFSTFDEPQYLISPISDTSEKPNDEAWIQVSRLVLCREGTLKFGSSVKEPSVPFVAGALYRDVVTGFEGICISTAEYLSGLNQFLLVPKHKPGSAFNQGVWLETFRLTLVECKIGADESEEVAPIGQDCPVKCLGIEPLSKIQSRSYTLIDALGQKRVLTTGQLSNRDMALSLFLGDYAFLHANFPRQRDGHVFDFDATQLPSFFDRLWDTERNASRGEGSR